MEPKQKRKLLKGIRGMIAQLQDDQLIQLDEILLDMVQDRDEGYTPEDFEIGAEIEKIWALRAMEPASTKFQ